MTIDRQWHSRRYNALACLAAAPVTRDAVVIDAVEDQEEEIRTLLLQLGRRLRYLLGTHLHDDHLSAAPRLRKLAGARTATPEYARMPVATSCCATLTASTSVIE